MHSWLGNRWKHIPRLSGAKVGYTGRIVTDRADWGTGVNDGGRW